MSLARLLKKRVTVTQCKYCEIVSFLSLARMLKKRVTVCQLIFVFFLMGAGTHVTPVRKLVVTMLD